MSMSATKRALIALAAIFLLAAVVAGVYLYRARRPMPAAAPSILPVPSVLSELPPDAPGVAYLDVAALRKLQGSPLAAMLGLAGANPASDRDYANFVRGTGFDYTRDLDKAAIAFWPASHIAEAGHLRSRRRHRRRPLRSTENQILRPPDGPRRDARLRRDLRSAR